MGNQASSSNGDPGHITIAQAKEYLSDEEFDRIRRAYARYKKTQMGFDGFCQDVLANAPISDDKRHRLFMYLSRGAETISFEALLTGLVGICKVESVQNGFAESLSEFATWGLRPPLLTRKEHDGYISFYEVMAYVTHLSVGEVKELEKVFVTISDRGLCKVTSATWAEATGGAFPADFLLRLFRAMDENRDGMLDFRELVCAVSAMCRGPVPSRLSFLAKLWDEDGDNRLNLEELEDLYESLKVPEEHRTIVCSVEVPEANGNGTVRAAAFADFAAWAMTCKENYTQAYYSMSLEVGHICLGLPVESPHVERTIVGSFELRARDAPLTEWCVASTAWHREWEQETSNGKQPPPVDATAIRASTSSNDEGAVWSTKYPCLTSECGRLKADLHRADYVLLPPVLFRALARWHGQKPNGESAFTRRRLPAEYFETGKPSVELYPLDVLITRRNLKDLASTTSIPWAYMQVSRSTSIGELSTRCRLELHPEAEVRLWTEKIDSTPAEKRELLDALRQTLHELGVKKSCQLLLEIRDRQTGIWPEEQRVAASGVEVASRAARDSNTNFGGEIGAAGLLNQGNYCYRNAAVQCLAHVAPLVDFLLDEDEITRLKSAATVNLHSRLTLELASLLKEMWTGGKRSVAPIGFNEVLRATREFTGNDQHDCQEFIAFLIDQLHTCLNRAKVERLNGMVAGGVDEKSKEEKANSKEEEKKSNKEAAEEEWQKYVRTNRSVVADLFSGQLRSTLTCNECKGESSVYEIFTSLSLPIGFENVDLYQVIVVGRDTQKIPVRYGFRLQREASVETLREALGKVTRRDKEEFAMIALSSQGRITHSEFPKSREEEVAWRLGQLHPSTRIYALELPPKCDNHVIAVHRKLQYNHEPYFLGSTGGYIVSVFGVPLALPLSTKTTGKELYEEVATQMSRFTQSASSSPVPSSAFHHLTSRALDSSEHDTSGYAFSIVLVNSNYEWCARCPGERFCRGCAVTPSATLVDLSDGELLAIDWVPLGLYLRYNHSQELAFTDDPSVAATCREHNQPSSLDGCLAAFARPEILEDAVQCDTCNKKTRRHKTMNIWRLPRYLIVHLKRFEYVAAERRIGKSRKVVDFPLKGFDATSFVSPEARDLADSPAAYHYDCIAIADHYGQLNTGHFVAYTRSGQRWFLYNDCTTQEVREEDVDKKNAYLIFYERKEQT